MGEKTLAAVVARIILLKCSKNVNIYKSYKFYSKIIIIIKIYA